MKAKKSRSGCLLWNFLIIIVLILMAGGWWFVRSLPDVGSQIPNTPMMISLGKPLNGSTAGVGSPLPVSAQAISPHPIVRMELWVDNALADTFVPVSVGTNQYRGSLSWTANATGEHVLVARATDDQGHIGVSNPARVNAILAADSMRMENFVARGGETLEDLASAHGSTVPDILTYNNGLTLGQPLKTGQEIWIPVPTSYAPPMASAPQALPPASGGGEGAAPALPPLVFWLQTNLLPSPASPPAAPGLTAVAQGCNAALSIEDHSSDESGFFLYRMGPGNAGFARIATLGPHSAGGPVAYTDSGLSGTYTYYAAAFNPRGESPSVMAQALVADGCAKEAWSGDLRLEGGLLLSPLAVDRAYVYASVNGGNWARVPSDPNAFLPAVQGGYDVGPYLANLTAGADGPVKTLSLDGWGWGGGALAHLGGGNASFLSGQAAGDLASLNLWTALEGSPWGSLGPDPSLIPFFPDEFSFPKPGDFLFRWKTGSEATGGRWQVSRSPYFLPETILAEGVTDMQPNWQGYSYFNIPFDELLPNAANIRNKPAAPLMHGPVSFGSDQSLQLDPGQSVFLTQPVLPGMAPVGGQNGGNTASFGNVSLPPIGGGKLNEYYVHLTPMNGNQAAGQVSNTFVVRYDPESGKSDIQIPVLGPEYYTPLYTVEILDYTPGAVEDPNHWGCVKIVKVYPGVISAGFNVGDVHCPDSFTGGGTQGWNGLVHDLGVLVGWAESGLNSVSEFFQDLKEFAVKIVLKYTPIGASCQFAEGVVLPEGACHDVITAAVDVGLASMGVPPSIPNFDQMMDQGLDYAVEMGAQEVLKDSPVPCVGPCEDAVKDTIRKTLKSAIDEVANQSIAPSCVSEDEAHENGREPWCPPPGVVVKPALTAVDSPPTVLLRVTRRPDVPDPANIPSCTLHVGALYTYHVGPANYPAPTGTPFSTDYLPIPPLAPGQSFQVAVSLTQKKVVDFPWDTPYYGGFAFHHWDNMVYYGTSHAYADASFVTPAYVQGTPSACAVQVTSPEKNSPNYNP